ncbi:MAG: SOS response-associated peptidase [Dongiaceae bacterium]
MCGRYSIATEPQVLHRLFHLDGAPALRPRYNAAPGQELPVVRLDKRGRRELALLRWGLIPSVAEVAAVGLGNINAQVETVHRMPAFRAAFRRRRCLVLADSFYKWQVTGEGKQPHRFVLKDGGPFAMAGLWERWEKGGEPVESFTIIVTVASEVVRPIHDRMPMILPPATHQEWLESEGATIPLALLQFRPTAEMVGYPVTPRLNSADNESADLIARLA